MDIEELLHAHAQNLQLRNLIESALIRLEHSLFEHMMSFPQLIEGIPVQPICKIYQQNNIFCITMDQFEYCIKTDAVSRHFNSCADIKDISIEQMMDAIMKELQVSIKLYFDSEI